MQIEGGCYCGNVRYAVEGDPMMKIQCHCRECQYISGGSPNVTLAIPDAGFGYTEGQAKEFRRKDLETPVTREFCGDCGTHLLSRAPSLPGTVLLKAGTFDDPSLFEAPGVAIYTADAQPFHHIPEGIPAFEQTPS